MEKIRIYELAKELNTTSKRLMEKLAEVNIIVKNHMSLLEENELKTLYEHIGVINPDNNKKAEIKEKKPVSTPKAKTENKKDNKGEPRIIRTTKIIVDSSTDDKNGSRDQKKDSFSDRGRRDNRGRGRSNPNRDFVVTADANSGLRAGFVLDTTPDYIRDAKAHTKSGVQGKTVEPAKTEPKIDELKGRKIEQKVEPQTEEKVESKIEPQIEQKTGLKTEGKLASSTEQQTELEKKPKIEAGSEAKANSKAKQRAKQIPDDNIKVESETRLDKHQEVKHGEVVETKSAQIIEQTIPQNEETKGEEQDKKLITDKKPQENKADKERTAEKGKTQDGNIYMEKNQNEQDIAEGPIETAKSTNKESKTGLGERKPKIEQTASNARREGGGRPAFDKSQNSDKPYKSSDRTQQSGNRPYNNRGTSDRPSYNKNQSGDRPQQSGDRPYNNRGSSDRPQYNRNQSGDRPQYGSARPYNNSGQNDRPQYNKNQSGDRPQYSSDRPQQSGSRPYNNRGPNDRPQYHNTQSGDRPQYNRGPNDRRTSTKYSSGPKPLEIPVPEFTEAQKEEAALQRAISRREVQSRDVDKEAKREQRKEIVKSQAPVKTRKLKPHELALNEKKDVSEVLSDDFVLVEEFYSEDNVKKTRKPIRQRKGNKVQSRGPETKHIPHRAVLTMIKIPESITVKDLAEALKKTSAEVIKKLMVMGQMVALNQEVDFDTATIIADEFGVKTEKEIIINEEDILFDDSTEDEENLSPRPPVVVVMGHVDHGKTSLLDAIRKAHVTDVEAGGITQHIGAYTVKINNRNITFLDTPGHEAFTAMRARGAQVTDIAILVVAADDGVMPQTIEAINHAKAANVSIIVAINKTDKPGANAERVKQELTEYGLVAEEWGGDTICVPVSAKNNENIDGLLEMVLLTADILELKANPDKQAKGTVVEAQLDKTRGPIATLLVQRGTLNVGDSIVTGTTFGRIRAMVDDKSNHIKSAGPSTPVEITGLPEVPEAGEIFYVVSDEKVAKQLVDKRKNTQREKHLRSSAKISLEDLYSQIKEGKVKDLNIIVKADVQGSVEAVKQSLEKLSNDEVRVNIIHGAVGAVTESDVSLAEVSNAIIIGFNVRPATNVADIAKDAEVDLRLYRIIYNAIEDIEAALKGMLEPKFKEVVLGHTEIRQIFKVSGIGTIGGCYVTDGKIVRNGDIRVVRDGIVIHEGKLASLKRFKDDAKEVLQGYECGLSIERFNDIKESDVVESFAMEEVTR